LSAARVELIPLLCTQCKQAVGANIDEVVWVCQNCGQGLVLSDEHGLLPQIIHYSAGIPVNTQGKPVWVASGQVTLQRQTYSGDQTKEMLEFWSLPRSFFIPAYAVNLDQLAETGIEMLRQPVPLQDSSSPAAFLPVTVHPEDIQPLAEYLVLAVEAARRDKLKSLSFTLQLGPPELWIFA
jgi:hypothetical protein